MKQLILALFIALCFSVNLYANCKAASLESLISVIEKSFIEGNIEDFSCVFENRETQGFLRQAVKAKVERSFDVGKIINSNRKEATVLLAGKADAGNSGDTTIVANLYFSGIYKAENTENGWKVKEKLSHEQNLINSQKIEAQIIPGKSLIVQNEMSVSVKTDFGFAVALNHRAKISKLLLDGKKSEYKFGGGLLWINIPKNKTAKISLEYEIEVDKNQKNRNSGFWAKDFGHVRNQFFWHPFFGFDSDTDIASFELTAKIPKDYKLVTSIPQTEKVIRENRVINAKSNGKVKMLTLLYDKDWQVTTKKFGNLKFEVFATKDFKPSVEKLQTEFQKVYKTLEKKFGKPVSNYYAIAQSRGRGGGGWHYRSNDLIAAGKNSGNMIWDKPFPRAPFAHEIAHAWTNPTGSGRNFLQEGWASFAEAYFIREKFGEQTEKQYFTEYQKIYEKRGFEGKNTILNDPSNGGIAYYKGVWIFKMLHDFVGEKKFIKGMKRFIKNSRKGKSDIKSFVDSFASVSKKDVRRFLKPWLEEKYLPNISANLNGNKLEINQKGIIFYLPLEIEFETEKGKLKKQFLISKSNESFDTAKLGEIKSFRIDPNNQLMLKRKNE